MPICPYCDADLSRWADRLRNAKNTNAPQVWTCPECDRVLGVSGGKAE